MSAHQKLPYDASIEVSDFAVHTPEKDLQSLAELLRLSKLGPKTYENTRADGEYGVTYEWMSKATEYWQSDFDW